jgi:hypothetical protein
MSDGGFLDQPQVERVRERLWSGREFGRAAVMVGAGFSRNARRSSPSVPLFPLWGGIADAMYDALYPQGGSSGEAAREDDKKRRTANATRLASEFETAFGRSALDDLLARAIPDESYEPSPIHEDLLSLPWSDVFTTNYDTLLERTRASVYERKYDLVLASSDVPAKARPRIVKLHGSFPSHRPFVVTEEDFRSYPTRSATFVNLVQQAIMENVFCLLGFSGDDPNFLSWTGWVRDNLGPSAPPVYLAGLLSLSGPQRRLLESRRVIPIDLSPLFPRSEWPDPLQRHARATEWFLSNLAEGRPPRVERWPLPSNPRPRERSEGLPEVPTGPRPIPDPGPDMPPPMGTATAEDLEGLLRRWSASRACYPGWAVAPSRNRTSLWRGTEYWIEPVLSSAEGLGAPEGLALLYELNWRLEKCLVPLFSGWDDRIGSVVETYNPFPRLVDVPEATVRPDTAEHRDLDWDSIAECWVDLAFALARTAREDQDEGRFRRWMDRLSNLRGRNEDWQARWFHEECLFHLFRLDQERAHSTLEEWPEAPTLPLWEVRRAAVLAELGLLDEAERVAGRALETVRSRMQPYGADHALLSQEGLALVLLEGIRANDVGIEEGMLSEFRDRLEELERYRCNPWVEIEKLEGTVVGVAPPLRGWRQETLPGFDPGHQTTNTNMPGGFSVDPILPAFVLLRTVEDGALPARVGSVNRFSETLLTAARWVEPHAPLWSFASMSRQAKEKEILRLWDRAYVVALPREVVDRLFGLLLNSLVQSIRHLADNPGEVGMWRWSFAQRQVKLASELLSRLSIRCSDEQREHLFDLAKQMYELPLFREHHLLHDCVKALFRRLLTYGMSRAQILQRVPDLLSLPVLGDTAIESGMSETWIDPVNLIRWDYERDIDPDLDRSSWAAPIDNLNRLVRSGNPEARKRASGRLAWLFDAGGLTDEQSTAFGEALWSRVDGRTGLPSDTAFLPYAFLSLPEPEPGRAKDAYRGYVLSLDFVRSVQYRDSATGRVQTVSSSPGGEGLPELLMRSTVPVAPWSPEDSRIFIDWSTEEAVLILRKIVALWDDEKEALAPYLAGGAMDAFGGIGQRIEGRLRLVGQVLLPRMAEAEDADRALAERFLAEIEQAGGPVSFALPTLLYANASLEEEVARKVAADIGSGDPARARSAAQGIYLWIEHAEQGSIAAPPGELLDKLINRTLSRKPAALNTVLGVLSNILRYHPRALSERQLDAIGVALGDLLDDTRLPAYGEREREERSAALLPVEWRPDYRRLAARLAYRLSKAYASRDGASPPEVLRQWELACAKDPLPEIRAAWASG